MILNADWVGVAQDDSWDANIIYLHYCIPTGEECHVQGEPDASEKSCVGQVPRWHHGHPKRERGETGWPVAIILFLFYC